MGMRRAQDRGMQRPRRHRQVVGIPAAASQERGVFETLDRLPDEACHRSARDGDPLYLDEQARLRQAGHRDERTRGEIVAEDLAADLGEAVAIARIGDEDRHRHHVLERAAGLLERAAQPREHLARLPLEIAGERAAGSVLGRGLSGEPDDCAALGDDGGRIGARLRLVALHEAACVRAVRHRTLPFAAPRCPLRPLLSTAALAGTPAQRLEDATCRNRPSPPQSRL